MNGTCLRAGVVSLAALALGFAIALTTSCAAREHTVVTERVRVERIQGAPCMDPPPEVEAIDWPNPDPVTGEVTLDAATVTEIGLALQRAQTYALLQYHRCAVTENTDDGAGLKAPDLPSRLACRPTTGKYDSCVVGWRAKPQARSSLWGWWP